MKMRLRNALLLLVALGGMNFDIPCAAEESDPPQTGNSAADLPAAVKELFRTRCADCHAGPEASGGFRVLDPENLRRNSYVVPRQPDDSRLLERIIASGDNRMPPDDAPLSREEIELVRTWIREGAPEFPEDVAVPPVTEPAGNRGDTYVLEQISGWVAKVPADERPHLRFFSTNHLLTGGATRAELQRQHAALEKAVNHLSHGTELVDLDPVDAPTSTVFVVDQRRLGWDREPFAHVVDGKVDATRNAGIDLFDLVLLEYPYGVALSGHGEWEQLLTDYVQPAGLVRPVIWVRADWFVSVATQPPLYHEILMLPDRLEDLAGDLRVDLDEVRRNHRIRRAAFSVSGVSRNNRVVEWYPGKTAGGGFWGSADFADNRGSNNVFRDPVNLRPGGGEFIFRLPNGLQGYFIVDDAGQRIDAAPTSVVTDRFASDGTVRNGLSCIRCHERGMKGFTDTVRLSLDQLPPQPGFDRKTALTMYPGQEAMDEIRHTWEQDFLKTMETLLQGQPQEEPIAPVSRRYLDVSLKINAIAGELGETDVKGLQAKFETPQFTSLGLMTLIPGGSIRRDAWEDYFPDVVRNLGLGKPVVPFDGLTRSDIIGSRAADMASRVVLETNRPGNLFTAGDQLTIRVCNNSIERLHAELVGVSSSGERVVLTHTIVEPGRCLQFPEKDAIRVEAGRGNEQIILFASPVEFPTGQVIRQRRDEDAPRRLVDRVIHQVKPGSTLPTRMFRKTLTIQTR